MAIAQRIDDEVMAREIEDWIKNSSHPQRISLASTLLHDLGMSRSKNEVFSTELERLLLLQVVWGDLANMAISNNGGYEREVSERNQQAVYVLEHEAELWHATFENFSLIELCQHIGGDSASLANTLNFILDCINDPLEWRS